MNTMLFLRKLRPAVSRSLNTRHRAVMAVLFILALVVAPTLIPPHGLLKSTRVEAATSPTGLPSADKQTRARAAESFGKLPLYFVENRGKLDKRVGYYVQGSDKTIYFTNQGLTFALNPKPEARPEERNDAALHPAADLSLTDNPQSAIRNQQSERWALKLDFVGARAGARPEGKELTGATFSYFKGQRSQWQAGVKSYSEIVYRNLWPGIDLVYAGTVNRMKYTFVVKPGADPNRIKLAWSGASGVKLNAAGELEVSTPAGGFTDERPVSWQETNGRQVEVASKYKIEAKGKQRNQQPATAAGGAIAYGFKVAKYDRSRELVIDPAVLVYCGFIGGSGSDSGSGIAVDSAGNAYVAGTTSSTEASFPVTVGPDLTYNGGQSDAFVAKVNASGTALVYCGYIGGTVGNFFTGGDRGSGIAVDAAGNAYVVGSTRSTEADFPVTVGPDLTFNGVQDAFVAKVNASGTALDYCGYIGGSGTDTGLGIAVDSAGNAYVTGFSGSTEATFPVTVGPDLTYNGGQSDAFVAKVNASGAALDYCGYIGGSDTEGGLSLAVDSAGNAYITGTSNSNEATFPVTVGPDLTYNGFDAFVAKVNASGTALDYCGYIGGSANDTGFGIAVDSAGNAYVTGTATSTEATFPVTVGPDLTHNGGLDAFVAKVNASGTALVYCGYIGGSSAGPEQGSGIAVDSAGNAYVTGTTSSTEASFPVTVGPDLTYNGGQVDAFVAKVNASGTALDYCGYIGGSGTDTGLGIAVDSAGNAYVTGDTRSTEASFTVTVGPDLTHNGGTDAFVAKIGTPTPQDQLSALIAQLEALIDAGTLTQNQGDGLIDKIEQVIVKLDNNQTGAACNQLNSFINQVNAFIGNGSLTQAQGQALIDAVNAIKANIGC